MFTNRNWGNPQLQCPDDTICFECGGPLPETPEPDTPGDRGFCDEDCELGKTGVSSLWDLAKHLDVWARNLDDGIRAHLYKATECGAGFRTVTDGVAVSGYVEGYDGHMPEHFLRFPFHIQDFFAALDSCDQEADEIWELIQEPKTADQVLREITDLDPEG